MRWNRLLVSGALALSLALTSVNPVLAAPSAKNVDTLVQVYQRLVSDHYSQPDQDELLQAAIEGMLDYVSDPYTAYMTPEEYLAFVSALNNDYAGVGAQLRATADGLVAVDEVFAGSPAEKAGLLAGDLILMVDGQPAGADVSAVAGRIRGKTGTSVTLRVRRGDNALTYTIIRGSINRPTVTEQDLGRGLAYIRILSMGEQTTDEFLNALRTARGRGAKHLVLDLRGNGGGLVTAALQIANLFLPDGSVLMTYHEDGEAVPIKANPGAKIDLPMAVLVDKHSASAAEILAGALQTNGRARLVGEKTFGKGTMQEPVMLPNGGVLKLTVDQFELAGGLVYDQVGLTPDLPVAIPELTAHAATQLLAPGPQALTFRRQEPLAEVNGYLIRTAPRVTEQEGRVYLPLRFALEALGIGVTWLGDEQAVSFKSGGRTAKAYLQRNALTLDGAPVGGDMTVISVDGRTYVSAEALGAVLGGTVETTAGAVTLQIGIR